MNNETQPLESDEKPIEKCGIVGVFSKKRKNVFPYLYSALISLQHRGQDAAGITVWDGHTLTSVKGLGLVSEAIDYEVEGYVGIAHVRYRTSGKITGREIQPLIEGNTAIAHNGQLVEYENLNKKTEQHDTRALLMYIKNKGSVLSEKFSNAWQDIKGAYSIVGLNKGVLFAVRDPYGIRPLTYGENEDIIAFVSESCAMDVLNIKSFSDVERGTLYYVKNKKIEKKPFEQKQKRLCMFEYVYFARPDSKLEGKCVHRVREEIGRLLAKKYKVKADVVSDIPDSARSTAYAFANESGIPYRECLIKNRYVGRTFIMANQKQRQNAVKIKFNVLKENVDGKDVVLVDDSIVRGTTVVEIIKMMKEAGAKKIHFMVGCPPIKHPCFYGINMTTYDELIASKKTIEEIRKYLGVDSLNYLTIEDLKSVVGEGVCTACLDKTYLF